MRRMLVLGGASYHPGGLEGFCKRAAQAVSAAGAGWTAEWRSTEAAYLDLRRLPGLARPLRDVFARRAGVDLIWLQFSTLADLLFLLEARALGIPVLVTPHLGANARLQRVAASRAFARRLLGLADRLGLLFAGQERDIALPALPISPVRTFLPAASLAQPVPVRAVGPLRLIHAGRLSEGKGTFRTIALCAALRARGVPFTARIVGRADAATMDRLRAAIADQGLGNRISLVEWLAPDALQQALGEADVLAHLSTLDAFPLIVLEAMVAGAVPVVGRMAGAMSMVAAHGGHIADDPAIAAEWLAVQPIEQLRRYGAAIAANVRAAYRWDVCAAQAIAAAEATLAARA